MALYTFEASELVEDRKDPLKKFSLQFHTKENKNYTKLYTQLEIHELFSRSCAIIILTLMFYKS